MTTALATTNGAPLSGATMERVVIEGDLSVLSASQRVEYYRAVCDSVGLNPFTKPFDYIKLSGKMVLYAKREATEQLRKLHGVSLAIVNRETIGDVYVVTAKAVDKTGRADESTGAVTLKGLTGEALANAYMKAETKAKRRVTLSVCGLGYLDETEVALIPNAKPMVVDIETGEILEAEVIAESAEAVIEQLPRPRTAKETRRWLQTEAAKNKALAEEMDQRAYAIALRNLKATAEDGHKFSEYVFGFASLAKAREEKKLTRGMCLALDRWVDAKPEPNPDGGKDLWVPRDESITEFKSIIAAYDAISRDAGLGDGLDTKGEPLQIEQQERML